MTLLKFVSGLSTIIWSRLVIRTVTVKRISILFLGVLEIGLEFLVICLPIIDPFALISQCCDMVKCPFVLNSQIPPIPISHPLSLNQEQSVFNPAILYYIKGCPLPSLTNRLKSVLIIFRFCYGHF